jgi:cytochrome c-type biogenesis protein
MIELSPLGIAAAFLAGTISFLSPCVLPLVPGYVSYIAGRSLDDVSAGGTDRLAVLGLSAWFVLGFSTVFVLLGASATALGRLLLAYRYELNIAGGALVILFGALMIGLVRVGWFERDLRFHTAMKGGRPVAAYALGLAFGFGWTPCIGPVLGAILTISATTAGIADGMSLLAVYSLGLGVPFLAVAAFTSVSLTRLGKFRRLGRGLHVGAGGVMVVMGVAMITGHLSELSYWFLNTFPVLAKIG